MYTLTWFSRELHVQAAQGRLHSFLPCQRKAVFLPLNDDGIGKLGCNKLGVFKNLLFSKASRVCAVPESLIQLGSHTCSPLPNEFTLHSVPKWSFEAIPG